MAFLDNSGDIILDAVLTDAGRKRMAEGRERYNEHKTKKTRAEEDLEDSGLRPGGAQTHQGPCNPSGNVAASSSNENRRGMKRGDVETQPNDDHQVIKYQRQDDEQEEEDQGMDTENAELQ